MRQAKATMSSSSQFSGQNIRSVSQTLSLYLIIILASTFLVLNPIVVGLLLNLETIPTIYLLLFDIALILIGGSSSFYLITKRKSYVYASFIGILCLPVFMVFVELTLTYVRLTYGDRWNGIELQNVHKTDPNLGWVPIPDARGRHLNPGNFDVIYEMDKKGRKAIPENRNIIRTIHFYGDSFAFGLGVNNENTALNILSTRLKSQFNVLNYAVIGYGLEQMAFRLHNNLGELKPNDVVVFSPLITDLFRTSKNLSFFCGIRMSQNKGVRVESIPEFRDSKWQVIDLQEECNLIETLIDNSHQMPIGTFRSRIDPAQNRKASLKHAGEILAQAAQLAKERKAHFLLVFLLTPQECKKGVLPFDLSILNMPFLSVASFCPQDPDIIETLQFPFDAHWSPDGNRWAADALEKVLNAALPQLVNQRVDRSALSTRPSRGTSQGPSGH